jgi:hypothetical protein
MANAMPCCAKGMISDYYARKGTVEKQKPSKKLGFCTDRQT